VVLIKRGLEGVRWSASCTRLLFTANIAHELVSFFLVLLAAPDLPCYNEQACRDGESSDANYYADDGGLGLG